MNYPESQQILEEIKKAKKILVNCHRGPDSDSVGSALGLSGVLESMGKEVFIICPSDIPNDLKFLKGSEKIKRVDFKNFNFSNYDLFIAIDSSTYSMISGSKEIDQPEIPFVVIDHHFSNEGFGMINLIDSKVTSTGELLYKVFEDWDVKLNPDIAQSILTGIIGDTGVFQYQNVGAETLEIAAKLIKLGANKDLIINQIYRNLPFSEIKLWGKIIENMEIDEKNHFVWSVVRISDYANFPGQESVKEDAANLFFPVVSGTDFGIIMEEREDGTLSVSFRSRSDFDVSKIADEVGGGGHKVAAGAKIEGLSFDEAVDKVLIAARKYAKKIRKFFTTENILVSIGLIIAFVLRVFRTGEILNFNYDQGRDALVIWDLIHSHKFFLIGPTTGIAGIFRGPFYYYSITPFYWLGHGNPIWPSVFLAITSVAALGLMYCLAKKIGGKLAGALALILGGLSIQIIGSSRWLSNPTPMLLLSMILVWMMFLIYDGKKWAWAVLSLVLGLSLFHFGSSGEVFYFPAVAIFAIWKFFISRGKIKNIPSLKIILISIGLFIFTVLPLVIFDMKHGGILSGNIGGLLAPGKSFGLPSWKFVSDRLSLIGNYFSSLLLNSPQEIVWGMEFVIVYFLSRLIKNPKFNIILILLVSPVFGLIFFQGNYGNFYSYYLTGYYLIFLIFIATSLSYIFKDSVIGKVIVIIFMSYFLINNFSDIRDYLYATDTGSDSIMLSNQLKVVDWIYKDANGKDFNVDEYVPPVITYSYNYLFTWLGNTKYHKLPVEPQISLLYTLYEVDPPHPERLDAWLTRQKGIGKVVKEQAFGGITVQERERIPGGK